MIRFIDITTGNIFNGSQPYVFWFDKEQSVNLNYVRKICILSTDEHLTITLPENPIFCLLDTAKMGNDIEVAGKKFKDLDNSGFKTFSFDSIGTQYDTFYIHMIYILGRSPEAGEYREILTIGNEDFMVGADFYNEREELSINLLNQGLEMPKLVEKAIYEFNVHEEGIDNILLNRKYKELLSEYINVLGNKGSYKSLINSLNWFEYGDLVKMLDYWKHEEPTRTIYSAEDIHQIVDKDIEDILTKSHKTTYIGLYLALTRISLDEDGNIVYEDQPTPQTISNISEIPEPIPSIDFVSAKWSAIDLSLKMTMLGNFFSTYFMPLHLDLIHSTIENIVYADTVKFFTWHTLRRQDWNHDIETFSCDVESKRYFMTDVKARVYPDTTFGDQYEAGKEELNIFGVDTQDREQYVGSIIYNSNILERNIDNDMVNMGNQYCAWGNYYTLYDSPKVGDAVYEYDLISGFMTPTGENNDGVVSDLVYEGGYVFDENTVKTYLEQRFEGPGVIVPFNCVLHNIQHGMYITEASIMVSHNGVDKLYHTYNVHNDSDEVNAKPESILISDNRILSRNIDNDINIDETIYYAWGDLYTTSNEPQVDDHLYKIEDDHMVLANYDVIKSIYKGDRHINFNILLQDIGDYQFTVDFKCGDGMHYIKKFKFVVYDDTQQEVKMYKIIRRDWNELNEILPKEKEDLLRFMFTQLDENDSLYRQFIATSDYAFLNKLGLNQVIIYEPQITWNGAADPTLSYHLAVGMFSAEGSGTADVVHSSMENLVNILNNTYKKYRFFVQDRLGLRIDDIVNTNWPDQVDRDNIIKYRNSKNIAYLYDILKRHEAESGIDRYYIIIPYIFGICLQFDMNSTTWICKDKTIGAYKNGISDEGKYSIKIDVDKAEVSMELQSKDKGSLIKTWALCKTNSNGNKLEWVEFTKELPEYSIIDDIIKIRFLLPKTQIIKEVDIKVPRLVNLEYDKKFLYQTYTIDGQTYRVAGQKYGQFISGNKVSDSRIDNYNIGRLYLQHKFIPIFHTFIEVPNRIIQQNDVVCFSPDLNMVRKDRYNPIGWTFTNSTTHEEIQPLPYNRKDLYWDWDESQGPKPNKKDQLVDPLEPMLGKYDLKKIIDPGYYNIDLEYELVTDHNERHRYISNSEFIVEK